jgi:hypothetical protein
MRVEQRRQAVGLLGPQRVRLGPFVHTFLNARPA